MADVKEVEVGQATADTTLVTTAETVAVSSDPITVPGVSGRALIIARAQVLTGTGTTSVNMRIRRGSGLTGTVVGEAIGVSIGAGVATLVSAMGVDEISNVDKLQYTLTVEQVGSSANGTIQNAHIATFLI